MLYLLVHELLDYIPLNSSYNIETFIEEFDIRII